MRLSALLTAIVMVLATACSTAAPQAPQQATAADIELTAPVSLTLWHAFSSDPQKKALDEMVAEFNATNGKASGHGLNQGNYTQLYQKTLGAIRPALPDSPAPESPYTKAGVDLTPYLVVRRASSRRRHLQGLLHRQFRSSATILSFIQQVAPRHVRERRPLKRRASDPRPDGSK